MNSFYKSYIFAALKQDPWLNWIEHLTTDQKVGGSNPSGFTG